MPTTTSTTRRKHPEPGPTPIGPEAGNLLAQFIRDFEAIPVRGLTPEQVRANHDKADRLRWPIRHLPNDAKVHIELRTRAIRNAQTNRPCRIMVTGAAHIGTPSSPEVLYVVTPVDTKSVADADDRVTAWLMRHLKPVTAEEVTK